MRRADGRGVRVLQLVGSLVLTAGFFVVLTFTIGPVLGAVNPAVSWVADRFGVSR